MTTHRGLNLDQTIVEANCWFKSIERIMKRDKRLLKCQSKRDRQSRKVTLLLAFLGEPGIKFLEAFFKPELPNSKTYKDLKSALLEACSVTPSLPKVSSCHKFSSIKQEDQETLSRFMLRVSEYATECQFAISRPLMVRNQFISGLKSDTLRNHLISDDSIDTAVTALKKAYRVQSYLKTLHSLGDNGEVSFTITVCGKSMKSPNSKL